VAGGEGGSMCTQQGRWGSSAGKGTDAAASQKRTGERGGARGEHGPTGEEGKWAGPREIVQFF
jgi:hypothetical protein